MALGLGQAVDDQAGGQAQPAVQPAHLLAVAGGQIVVDGDQVHALAARARSDRPAGWRPASCPRRCASRRCRPCAGSCRRPAARRSGACRAPAWTPPAPRRRLRAAGRPGSRPSPRRPLNSGGHGLELVVAHGREAGLQRIDRGHAALQLLDLALVGGAEEPSWRNRASRVQTWRRAAARRDGGGRAPI